jgi:hypothetical protein
MFIPRIPVRAEEKQCCYSHVQAKKCNKVQKTKKKTRKGQWVAATLQCNEIDSVTISKKGPCPGEKVYAVGRA